MANGRLARSGRAALEESAFILVPLFLMIDPPFGLSKANLRKYALHLLPYCLLAVRRGDLGGHYPESFVPLQRRKFFAACSCMAHVAEKFRQGDVDLGPGMPRRYFLDPDQ